jgi:hypothetical protein
LDHHISGATRCFFGIWDGWSWQRTVATPGEVVDSKLPVSPTRSTDDLSFAFSGQEVERPRLRLPGRSYVVLSGELFAATQISGCVSPVSPALIWPENHAWFLASEIDFDSTIIGGTEDLVGAILEAPELEAWQVAADDSLTHDADEINRVRRA